MNAPDWKALIGTLAPTVATALGGPFAGMAVSTLSDVFFQSKTGTLSDIAAALKDPSQLEKLKEAEQCFTEKMRELEIKETELLTKDRASARDMYISTRDIMPAVLAAVVFSGFFGILCALIFVAIPAQSVSPLNIMLGSLGTIVVQIAAFYYGTSKGSSDKTKIFRGLLDRINPLKGGDGNV